MAGQYPERVLPRKNFTKILAESLLKFGVSNLYLQIKITIFKDLVATANAIRVPMTIIDR